MTGATLHTTSSSSCYLATSRTTEDAPLVRPAATSQPRAPLKMNHYTSSSSCYLTTTSPHRSQKPQELPKPCQTKKSKPTSPVNSHAHVLPANHIVHPHLNLGLQGIVKAGGSIEDSTQMVRLWTHEVLRVFYDRWVACGSVLAWLAVNPNPGIPDYELPPAHSRITQRSTSP